MNEFVEPTPKTPLQPIEMNVLKLSLNRISLLSIFFVVVVVALVPLIMSQYISGLGAFISTTNNRIAKIANANTHLLASLRT